MKVQEKLPYALAAIDSIADHHDADTTLRSVALDKIEEHIAAKRKALEAEAAADIAEAFPTTEAQVITGADVAVIRAADLEG